MDNDSRSCGISLSQSSIVKKLPFKNNSEAFSWCPIYTAVSLRILLLSTVNNTTHCVKSTVNVEPILRLKFRLYFYGSDLAAGAELSQIIYSEEISIAFNCKKFYSIEKNIR
ncbi:hypothetical protein RF11_14120 [Thelohanellus kitauei]|uniref:Uncharacterized protein n=1 Tax=Thelohanellus kitauei TaxID=669202 RepID=A0A0C2MBE3_THEKT|nr:hypothetical protein RF11_14120 [Thelohanellus kitauei]